MSKSKEYSKQCLYCGSCFKTKYSLAKFCCKTHNYKYHTKKVKELKQELRENIYKQMMNKFNQDG